MKMYDAIVIGLGAFGTSACLHIAQRGGRVMGLDRFGIGSARSASHGATRAFRVAYYEHPDYVPLLKRASALFDDLERDSGRTLQHRTGGIYIGAAEGELVRGSMKAAAEHGLESTNLTHGALLEKYPQFSVPESHVGFFEPTARVLMSDRIVCAQAMGALSHGAVLYPHDPALGFEQMDDHVRVRTKHGTYACKQLIVTAGAWTDQLVTSLGVPLKVTRQVAGWVVPKDSARLVLGAFPVWAIEHEDTTLHYGFPMLDAHDGMKLAHHHLDRAIDIDRDPMVADFDDEGDFRWVLREYLKAGDGPLLRVDVCHYTNTPDRHFIVDRLPDQDRVIVACGFSGHGFKFASVLGEALADLAMDGGTELPIEFLGLSRFS